MTSHQRRRSAIFVATVIATLPASIAFGQARAVGMDFSDYQGSATNFTNIKNAGYSFLFLRASRGGTTGTWDQSSKTGTGNFRYDDLYWINNVNGAKAVGLFTGAYHFDRADSLTTSNTNATIIARAQQEADHLLQVAGPWIKPGYLRPVLDLEAGAGLSQSQLSLFATTFADRIYAAKKVYPICYVNSSYANDEVNSTVATKMPDLWLARPSSGSNHATGDPVPASSYPNAYGKWNPTYPNTPNPHPWKFWQDGAASGTGYFGDYNVAHGTVEWVKDYLVPVYWTANASGDWATVANWNTNTDANDAVTDAEDPENQYKINGVLNHNDVTRAGKAPAARLPGNVSASLTLTGADDTVILDNTASTAAYTVTLSTGSYNIRKLYAKRPLNITGGLLTINYDPTTANAVGTATAIGSTTFSAQFSDAVTLSGGALSVHTLIVDPSKTFTISGGTLTLNKITVNSAAKLLINGNTTLAPLASTAATVTGTGTIDFGGTSPTLTVNDGPAATDLTFDVALANGAFTKAGAGTLRLNKTATLNSPVTVSAGTLIATLNNQLGTGVSVAAGGSLYLNGNLSYAVPITLAGAGASGASGTTAPGNPGNLHVASGNATWSGAVSLAGTGSNSSDPALNTVSAASGATLTLSGQIAPNAVGAAFGLAKAGDGSVVLTGASANTYNGISRVYGGQLVLEKDAALGNAVNHTFVLAGSTSTIAFRSASSLSYATAEYLHTEGTGSSGLSQVDNLGGNNTFAGSIAFGGPTIGGTVTGSVGVSSGSLTVGGGLYARSGFASADRLIHKNGTGTLTLTGDSSVASASASALPLTNSTLRINGGTVDLQSPNPSSANVPGITTFNVTAGASLLNTAGTLSGVAMNVDPAGVFNQTNGRLLATSLNLSNGAAATIGASATDASVLAGLNLSGTGKLTLNRTMVLDYSGSTPADLQRQRLLSGRNGGAWNGAGIASALAGGDAGLRIGLGYVEASDLLGLTGVETTIWSGATVDATTLLFKPTWYGDANLDGVVDLDDYVRLDRGIAKGLTGWFNGDFNYDNLIDGADYGLIDRVYIQQGAPLLPEFLAMRESQFGPEYVQSLLASVPEPSTLAAAIMGAFLFPRRHRRR